MPVSNWQEFQREMDLIKAAEWRDAVEKLQVQFEATHGGGHPDCLKDMSPTQRLRRLRELGFRVRERYVMDMAVGPEEREEQSWARLYGGIAINLNDGWVCEGAK